LEDEALKRVDVSHTHWLQVACIQSTALERYRSIDLCA
jgi:hypothetical protein